MEFYLEKCARVSLKMARFVGNTLVNEIKELESM